MLLRSSTFALLVFTLTLVVACAPASATPVRHKQINLWVSPIGSDRADGSKRHPFGTLRRARDVVRAELRTQRSDIVVNLLDGTYRLTETLSLDSRDSGSNGQTVTYRAAQHARPLISGGLQVKNWSLFNNGLNIYRAKVPVGTQTRQLFVNGRRALRARGTAYPNGFVRTAGGFEAPDDSMSAWGNQSDIEAVTLDQWKMMRCPVASIQGRQITMQQPCWDNVNVFPYLWSFQTIARLENAYELLDSAALRGHHLPQQLLAVPAALFQRVPVRGSSGQRR